MKKIVWIALLALSFFLPGLGDDLAAQHAIDAWLNDCMKKNPSTTGVNDCLGQAFEKWDRELNRVYRELNGRLNAEAKAVLRETQRAWIAFRDRELAFLARFYGGLDGTMYGSMLAADRVELVRRRVMELASLLDVLQQQ
jgi:uncharacterized protein YecT (DUF1311 family)